MVTMASERRTAGNKREEEASNEGEGIDREGEAEVEATDINSADL
jgi:hypothetical protein